MPIPEAHGAPERETLVASVKSVTFHNAGTGFAILRVKARGRRDLVPLVGHAATIAAGETIHAVSTLTTGRTHGLQFRADTLKTTAPTSAEGIARYLGSGMVRGIGPKLATRIVALFGLDTFEVIEADPARLREVAGVAPRRGWATKFEMRSAPLHHAARRATSSGSERLKYGRLSDLAPIAAPLPLGRHGR